jgi:hypothetical protein
MKKLLIVVIVILSGCSKPNDAFETLNLKLEDFAQKVNLTGQKFTFDSLLNPRKIMLKNDVLVVSNDGGGYFLHLIDKNQLIYLASKGIRGEGPGQIRSMVWELDEGLGDSTFWAYDLNTKSIHEFDLRDTSKLAMRKISQKQDWHQGFSNHWISPNKIISNISQDNFKFGVFDSLGNRVDSFGSWSSDQTTDPKLGYLLLGLHQGPIEFNSKNQILVHSRSQFELLEINNLETGKTIGIYGPNVYEVKYETIDNGELPYAIVNAEIPKGYSDVFVGDKSIFAVYIGKTRESINSSGETSRMIFEFDLQGKPLSIFSLDYPIGAITVDEKDKKIYAITEDREPGIAVFDY